MSIKDKVTDEMAAELNRKENGKTIVEKTKSLRDEFAMAALNGIMGKVTIVENSKTLAAACYNIADAMMKERQK
jgi:hypothetical protein